MKKVFNTSETFGHVYYTSIDEQLKHWEEEPYEAMAELEIAEAQVDEEECRANAYKAIAEKLHNNMDELQIAYLEAREAYIKWEQMCIEKGVY